MTTEIKLEFVIVDKKREHAEGKVCPAMTTEIKLEFFKVRICYSR
jgi:hypothetical protein